MTLIQTALPLPDVPPSSVAAQSLPRERRIYVNRNLRLDRAELIGFDMDYTLAIYDQAEIDRLSIDWTVRKLVAERGYPALLGELAYRTDFPVRGLLVDKLHGHVLKMDRYKYVLRAYHGMRELSKEDRRALYAARRVRAGTSRFHWVDTLYALPEVAVYSGVVDACEKHGIAIDFDRLFSDIRECIDNAHRDDSIPDAVLADLPRYVLRDPDLAPTLHKFRSAGKRLFLLTNSRWDYTDRMMSYLLDDAMAEYPSWRNFFDIVIVAAEKPRFFAERRHFRERTNGGTRPAGSLERGRVYEGGSIAEFEKLAGARGDSVLYIGDHIYGDVLRAKKETAWRTAMIIQEMFAEIEAHERTHEERERLAELDQRRERLEDELRYRQARLRRVERRIAEQKAVARGERASDVERDAEEGEDGDAQLVELEPTRVRQKRFIEKIRASLHQIEQEHRGLRHTIERVFHPYFGSLFKAGVEVSSFGHQVEEYACLYTSRVSNFLNYSPLQYFRSPRDLMPHEL